MESIREYLLSVTAAALLCAIVSSLTGEKGSQAGTVKLICGLFLCITVIRPLAQLHISDYSDFTRDLLEQGESATQEGEDYSRQALRRIIQEEAEAYIMDKASDYGTKLQANVTLSDTDPPVPESCVLTGSVSPYVRQQLKKILETDLGIPEENQIWMNG